MICLRYEAHVSVVIMSKIKNSETGPDRGMVWTEE